MASLKLSISAITPLLSKRTERLCSTFSVIRCSISVCCWRSAAFKLIALCCKSNASVGEGSALYCINERKNISN